MTGSDIVNTDQYIAWNGDSGRRWTADPDRRDQVLAPVAEVLLAAAALEPGEEVLDIGCGCGALTLTAADQLGPDAEAWGVDISEPMLAVAADRAVRAGAANVHFEHGDAQTHHFAGRSFDVAISRFGTMFFDDPAAAFTNVARALRPAGRLCIATWQPLAANDWLTIPGAALLDYGSLPESVDGPGMFAQSDPDLLVATLTEAGYEMIEPQPTTVTLALGADPADAVEYLADTGPARAVLATIPERDQAAALDAVQSVLANFQTPGGVHLDAGIWITRAIRSD